MIKLRSLPLRVSLRTSLRASLYVPLCIPLCILLSAFAFPASSQAQGVAPAVRIVSRIDESQLITLKGNTHPFANAAHDQGKVADSLPMSDLILVLSRDPAQQAAFDAYVAGEYDQNSPNFHQWLTPDQIGEQFGPSQTDILTITNWLTGHGFAVSQVTRDHMSIRFSGNAGQVQSTFHTEIHNLTVKGQAHIGNMSDPQIPASLSTVVIGVKSLHNFFAKPMHRMGQTVQRDASSGKWARQAPVGALSSTGAGSAKPFSTAGANSTLPLPSAVANSRSASPQFGVSVSGAYPYLVEDVGPWDFATIYNITPLWNSGIDGTGQTIAIAGTSAIDIGESNTQVTGANGYNDVNTFRTFFNLPTGNSWNTPIQVSGNSHALQVCTDTTGTLPCGIDDLLENSLDVEWSASIAKNAQVVLVASYPTSTTDDNLYDSESYIVDNVGNSSSPVYGVHVMNVSYGECELSLGTAGNVQYYDMWQTAAAEGLAVIVAAGDSGSASCDDGGYVAESGLTVSGLASTPWNTAVGGTDFNWCPAQDFFNSPTTECTASPHWNSTNSSNQSTAAGYVPEVPWNETCANPLALTWVQDIANEIYSYPTSDVTTPEQACNFIYLATQEGQLSNYYDYGTYLVNVVGGSGGASSCVTNTTSSSITNSTLGTCTASSGAGSTGGTTNPDTGATQASLATYNNGWPKPSWQTGVAGIPADGVRDLPDVSFFAADGFLSSSAYLICVSQDSSQYGTNQACNYSSKVEPVAQEVGGTSVATPAMAGIVALINQKSGAAQGSPNAGLYALAAKQTYSNCSAESVTASSTCYFNDIDQYTNAQPCDAVDKTPNCTATQSTLGNSDEIGILSGYSATTGFDLATGLGSLNIANVVNAWTKAATGSTVPSVTVKPSPTSINSSNTLSVAVTVAGGTGSVPPTGTVTLTASGSTYTATNTLSNGSYTFTIPANSLPGNTTGETDTLTASYAGDVTYAAKTGTGTVTVTTSATSLLTPTIAVSPASSTLNSSSSLNVTISVSGSGVIPTGTITLSASSGSYTGTTQTIGTAPCTSNTSCVFTIPANSLGSGSVTLTAKYSGDSNYAAGQNTGSVTVTESTFTLNNPAVAVTPAAAGNSSGIAPGSSASAVVTVAATAGYTGIVTLTCAQTSTTASGGDGTTCNPTGSDQINLATCGGSCSVTFTIGTYPAITAALERPRLPGNNQRPVNHEWLGAGSGAILALLAFFGIPARRRSWRSMLSILVAMVAIGTLASCGGGTTNSGGGGGQSDPGTTAGTYTFTVTASASPSVTPTVTQTFTVTVN
jgi:hypothetical protein